MRRLKYGLFLLALSVVLALAGCQAAPAAGKAMNVDGGAYLNVSAGELQNMMLQKDFLLVNVHIPFEGNLPKTDLSIAYDTIGQNLAKLPADKHAKIVLYCRSGSMSTMAAKELVKLGYTNIWNLDGGMISWEQAGQKIEK